MELIRLTSASDPLAGRVPELYEEAFPPEERTSTERLLQMIGQCPQMHFNAVVEDGEFCGMAVIWDLGICRYLLYLAMLRERRNQGLGASVLEALKKESSLPILAEVELPKEPVQRRRIEFYRRNGFHIESENPSLLNDAHSDPRCRLMLISAGHPDNVKACQRAVIDVVYRALHQRQDP